MSKIEMGRVYRTRDGREVRIYAVDGGGEYPVHGARESDEGWIGSVWGRDGNFHMNKFSCDHDLIEVKPRIQREVWVNVYRYDNGQVHWSAFDRRDAADDEPDDRIACVKLVIDCEEGEGL